MRKIPCLIFILFPFLQLSGQQVSKDFSKIKWEENFNIISEQWPATYTSDNFFIIQNGNYELFRKNDKSGFYIFQDNVNDEFDYFELNTIVSFGSNSNKKQSVGLVFQAQANGSGALILEVNQKREFRLKRLSTAGEQYLTGSVNKKGWVKSKRNLKKSINKIKIKTYEKIYDVYLNDKYVYTFTEIEFSKGKVGVYIGPNSKANVDFLQLNVSDDYNISNQNPGTDVNEEKSFQQIIVKLRESINKKQKEIDELESQLMTCNRTKNIDTSVLRIMKESSNRVAFLEKKVTKIEDTLVMLKLENYRLNEFRKSVQEQENGDIIINLTNINSKQKSQIENLESQKKQYEFELSSLKNDHKRLVSDTAILRNRLSSLEQRLYEKDSVISALWMENNEMKKAIEKEGNKDRNGGGNRPFDNSIIEPSNSDEQFFNNINSGTKSFKARRKKSKI